MMEMAKWTVEMDSGGMKIIIDVEGILRSCLRNFKACHDGITVQAIYEKSIKNVQVA
jgi:hypothetical protein